MYYLIGEKLKHSYSKEIHTLNGFDYDLKEIKREELDKFLKDKDFEGLNVTIPYKESVLPYLDFVSPLAKEVKAVNTIVNKGGKLLGFNTDVLGLLKSLEDVDFSGRKVLILGSGGASKAARVVTFKKKGEPVIISRKGEDNYINLDKHSDAYFIINATPVGMYPNVKNSPISLKQFKNLYGVFDFVYNPKNTMFLMEAKDMGIYFKGGFDMLIWQAVASEKLFANSGDILEEDIELNDKPRLNTKNIALIGMPYSGKTTIGRELAKVINYKFIDLDFEIEKRGESIDSLIKKGRFRDIESDVLKEFSRLSRQVISTGGGIVLRDSNVFELKRNSDIVCVKRDILPSNFSSRPLVKNEKEYKRLKAEREPLYNNAKDIEISNNNDIMSAVDEIIKKLDLERV